MYPSCGCGGEFLPTSEPHPDNTASLSILFMCQQCGELKEFAYELPDIRDVVSRNLLQYINSELNSKSTLLTDAINLKSWNFEPNAPEWKGLGWALADLQQKGVVEQVSLDRTSFKLTLVGWLVLWHGVY